MARHFSLGVHIGHDRGAALVKNGELVAQIAEERLDRRKHSNSPELPMKSIRTLLEMGRLTPADLGVVGISYTNVEIDNILPQLAEEIRDVLGTPTLDVIGLSHHDCHAWSTYYTSDFDAALIVVADGSGDIVGGRIEAESVYAASGNSIELIDRRYQDFGLTRMTRRNSFQLPYMDNVERNKSISLGRKYEQFTYLIGFEHGESGKTMGLAAYAQPLFEPQIPEIKGLNFPLTFEVGLVDIDSAWRRSGIAWHRFLKEQAPAIAASAQKLLEGYMETLLNAFNPSGAHKALCGAGGVFLNCQMNGRILSKTRFEQLHVVPAAGDDGQCIGAAFCAYARTFGPPTRTSSALPYLGPQYAREVIQERLDHFRLTSKQFDDGWLVDRMSADLADGKIVGLLRGRSEVGPRALCHRSLLADPRRSGMKDCLNYLKGRELFRPFAPVVTAEDQFKYFELEHLSPYMLLATRLRPEFREVLPAITHVDGSARVQCVEREAEPFVHSLLRSFESRTGHPLLLNTSFNLAGDPIVESPHDAIVTYLNSDIDVLIMDNFYVDKRGSVR
jgi:carbamoyltransferase